MSDTNIYAETCQTLILAMKSKKLQTTFPVTTVEGRIHLVRGRKVILDRDLAELYGVSTKALNQAVKRNTQRFPDEFVFRLTTEEAGALRSQSVTLTEHDPNRSQIVTGSHTVIVLRVFRAPRPSTGCLRPARARPAPCRWTPSHGALSCVSCLHLTSFGKSFKPEKMRLLSAEAFLSSMA
jgi:hypothetical protein